MVSRNSKQGCISVLRQQFQQLKNANGTYSIYVRGVDRFTSNLQQIVADAIYDSPFDPADALWQSFQEKTNQFINNNGGSSGINTPVHNRPDWEKIQDVLQGNRSISELGCD